MTQIGLAQDFPWPAELGLCDVAESDACRILLKLYNDIRTLKEKYTVSVQLI